MKSGLFHRRSVLSPLNRPDVWSRWTSRLEPCSGRRRGWARAWRRGSCEPAGGCCSGTRRSATTHPLRSDPYQHVFGLVKPLSSTHLRGGGVEPTADGPVAVLTREMSVFMNCTEKTSNRHVMPDTDAWGKLRWSFSLTSRRFSWPPAEV